MASRLFLYVLIVSAASHVNGQQKAVNETVVGCDDVEDTCEHYWSRGWYTCEVGAVLYDFCKKRCGYCDKVPIPRPHPKICMDYERECPHWAKYYDCLHKPKFMRIYCKKSCGWCPEDKKPPQVNYDCVNKDSECRRKALKNDCLFKRKHMSKNCMKTCKMCSFYSECNDKDSLCIWWKKKGYCHPSTGHKDFMVKTCPFTCQYCSEHNAKKEAKKKQFGEVTNKQTNK